MTTDRCRPYGISRPATPPDVYEQALAWVRDSFDLLKLSASTWEPRPERTTE